jgi:hypothetical protein
MMPSPNLLAAVTFPGELIKSPEAHWVATLGTQSVWSPKAEHHHLFSESPKVTSFVSKTKTNWLTVSTIEAFGAPVISENNVLADSCKVSDLAAAKVVSPNWANLHRISVAREYAPPTDLVLTSQAEAEASYKATPVPAKNLVESSSFLNTAEPWQAAAKTGKGVSCGLGAPVKPFMLGTTLAQFTNIPGIVEFISGA